MKKMIFIALLTASAFAVAEPVASYFRNRYTGVVMSYVAGLGTNSIVEFDYASAVPCRLAEVNATTNGIDTAVVVNRIWVYQRARTVTEVTTNFGYSVTNVYHAGYVTEEVTNQIYDSSTDTLPVAGHFIDGDVVQVSLNSVTGAIIRLTGTAE